MTNRSDPSRAPLQPGRAVELRAVRHRARRIDRRARLVERAPLADAVEVLERQAERVHHVVTARAGRVLPMLRDPLAHRQHGRGKRRRLELGDVRRRRRRRDAEQVLENPLAADDRRRAIGIRRHREDAALPEQTAAHAVRTELDAPEPAPLHVGDAVVARQPFVDERVVGAQQVERAAILAHDALEEQLGLAAERLTQRVVEVRESSVAPESPPPGSGGTATVRRIARRTW